MNQELPTSLRLGGSPTKKKRLSWQMQKRKWQYQVLSAFRKVHMRSIALLPSTVTHIRPVAF